MDEPFSIRVHKRIARETVTISSDMIAAALAPRIIAQAAPAFSTGAAVGLNFIFCQSYGNSLPQSKQTMYVFGEAFTSARRVAFGVIGKVVLL
jgi:hypothetical protein